MKNNKINIHHYFENGFLSPVNIIDQDEALKHRKKLEDAEEILGPLHYKSKIHILLKSAFDLAANKNILDVVEMILGPDILLYNVTYIIKEPNTNAHAENPSLMQILEKIKKLSKSRIARAPRLKCSSPQGPR